MPPTRRNGPLVATDRHSSIAGHYPHDALQTAETYSNILSYNDSAQLRGSGLRTPILRRNPRSRARLKQRALSLKQRASDDPFRLSDCALKTALDCASDRL